MARTVYLAGLISTEKPASLQWRLDAMPKLKSYDLSVLTPMRGKHDLINTSKDGGLNDPSLTSKDIIHRDYGDVSKTDVILANLDSFGSTRPLIGTLYELAWAWQKKISVVAVVDTANSLMRNHPFVKETVSHYCDTIEEAIHMVAKYYLVPEEE